MAAHITCGTISFNLFFPFLAPVFCFCTIFMTMNVMPEKWHLYHFHKMFFVALGQMIVGIVVEIVLIFIKKNEKRKVSESKVDAQNHGLVFLQKTNNYDWIIITGLVLITAFLDYFGFMGILYQLTLFPCTATKTTHIIMQFIFATIICNRFLKLGLYIHHAVSFGIILIGYGIVISGSYQRILNGHPLYSLFCCTSFFLMFSIREAIEKYMMDHKYCRPFFLLIFEGLFGVIISLILISGFSTVRCEGFFMNIEFCNPLYQQYISDFKAFLEMRTEDTWWMFLLLTIPGGGFSSFTKLTNFHFSPIHRTVSDIISSFFYLICFESRSGLGASNTILQFFGNIIFFFGLLIYNEFIIIHVFGLEKETRIEIQKRANKENCGLLYSTSDIEMNNSEVF